MKQTHSLRRFADHTLIIISLLLVIFLPRVLAGWSYLNLARDFFSQASYRQAAISFEDSARRLWWMDGLYEQAAQSAWLAEDAPGALKLFEIAREMDGLSSYGKLILGDVYLQLGDVHSAVAAWESIGLGDPDSAGAQARLAQVHRRLGDYAEALKNWQAVLKIEPQNGEARFNLALIRMTIQPEDALPELMLALSLEPGLDEKVQVLRLGLNQALLQDDLAYQLVLSGQSLASIGDWDLALEAFLRASQAAPGFSEAWAWQGEAYQHLGGDGLPALKKALDLDRNSITSLALNGLYHRRQGQTDQAWSFYVRTARLDPSNSSWQEVLGELSVQKGDLIEALDYYRKAVELSPKNPASWRALALFCVQYNMNVEKLGLRAALQALELEPENWRSQDIMGQVFMAKDDLVTASRYFNKSIQLAPGQPDSYLHLGYLYLLHDQRDQAYHNLVMARKLDLDGSVGLRAQRLLDQYFP